MRRYNTTHSKQVKKFIQFFGYRKSKKVIQFDRIPSVVELWLVCLRVVVPVMVISSVSVFVFFNMFPQTITFLVQKNIFQLWAVWGSAGIICIIGNMLLFSRFFSFLSELQHAYKQVLVDTILSIEPVQFSEISRSQLQVVVHNAVDAIPKMFVSFATNAAVSILNFIGMAVVVSVFSPILGVWVSVSIIFQICFVMWYYYYILQPIDCRYTMVDQSSKKGMSEIIYSIFHIKSLFSAQDVYRVSEYANSKLIRYTQLQAIATFGFSYILRFIWFITLLGLIALAYSQNLFTEQPQYTIAYIISYVTTFAYIKLVGEIISTFSNSREHIKSAQSFITTMQV